MKKALVKVWKGLGKPLRKQITRFNYNFSAGIPFRDIRKYAMGNFKRAYYNIVDGGSANGGTILGWKKYFPYSYVYGFEPIKNTEIKQVENSFLDVKVFHLALGDKEETKKFNVNEYTDTSSFYDNKATKKTYNTKKIIDVKLITLDKWCEINSVEVHILKLDLQGYELNALKGAKYQLKNNIRCILVESSFKEIYVNQPLFCDINNFLKKYGFTLHKLYGAEKEKLGFVDCLFVKDGKYES